MKKLILLAGIVAAVIGIKKLMGGGENDEFAPANDEYAPAA